MTSPSTSRALTELKLPRKIEIDPKCEQITRVLAESRALLWEGSPYRIAELEWNPAVERVLSNALLSKKLELGIETIERVLEQQKRGLDAMFAKQGTASANRISRLIITSNDGSERLYRACESLLTKHGDRVLVIRFKVPAARMGEKIFGPDRAIKAILVTDREHVENVLLALVTSPQN